MIKKWNLWLALFWIALGILLFAAAVTGVADSVFSGMGGGLLGVGGLQLVRYFRYQKDSEFREKWDTENTDERNRFLSGKAWAWASTLYVILGGIGVIVLHRQSRGIRFAAYARTDTRYLIGGKRDSYSRSADQHTLFNFPAHNCFADFSSEFRIIICTVIRVIVAIVNTFMSHFFEEFHECQLKFHACVVTSKTDFHCCSLLYFADIN